MGWVNRIVRGGTVVLLSAPRALAAQTCAPPPHPYFEFQVEARAAFLPNSGISPRPATRRVARAQDEAALVQFVVDTLGRPDTASFKVLLPRDPALAAAAREVLPRWRFRPAARGGCVVPQVFQTPLER